LQETEDDNIIPIQNVLLNCPIVTVNYHNDMVCPCLYHHSQYQTIFWW